MRNLALAVSVATALTVAVPAAAAPSAGALDGASLTAAASTGATASGYTGKGVGVALVDTGVSPQPTLGAQVAARIDVSGIGRNTDGLGHGTFLAGLVVGQEGPHGLRLGIAPDAHLVSVKVADAEGRTSLDRLLAGFAAIKAAPAELNIRVIVLAIGGPSDELADPLEEALEAMWADGYVVVVASGNTGGYLTEPGTSPYLLTVGGLDDNATAEHGDDTLPAWSGVGVGRDGNAKPDVLAVGRSVVSSRVPGSIADRLNPESRIDGQWFRGSGTSQAAAVAGGAAAVLLEAQPHLTPDEVKGRLVDSARPVAGSHAGAIDLPAAIESTAVANTHLAPLEASAVPATMDDWQGKSWAGKSWAADLWVGKSWAGDSWTGTHWVGKSWAQFDWQGGHWVGKSWADAEWVGKSWANDEWNGKSWAGKSWAGGSWFGKSWAGKSWAGGSWSSAVWTGRSWT